MKKPHARVAIITRTKDRPVMLPRAMKSVLKQTYHDYLHVIVNDAGNKELVESVVEPFRERYGNKLLVVHKDKSTGMEGASNTAIAACKSDFILIHDDDDTLHPEFLQTMVEFMDTPYPFSNLGGVICHTDAIHERVDKTNIHKVSQKPFNHWVSEVTLWRMCAWNFFPPISFLFKRSALDAVGHFDETLPVLGDWEFNLRILEKFEIGVVRRPLAYYHHRVTDKGENSAYANSIIGGIGKHQLYTSYLKNEMLRRDLAEGKFGLGFLINQNPQIERLMALSHTIEEVGRPFLGVARRMQRGANKVRGLWKRG